MSLESATYVSDLNPSNPTGGDPRSQLDDQIRLVKTVLQNTLPDGSAPIYGLRSGTATATTSGTAVNFTSIPSWVKRITVSLAGVSTNGTSLPIVQIGDSGGVETSGYLGAVASVVGTAATNLSTGFALTQVLGAVSVMHGRLVLDLLDAATNTWAASSSIGLSSGSSMFTMGGSKSLSATLDRVRLTTVNGTDTFDAGSVNILYE